jgi:hypothetical protein
VFFGTGIVREWGPPGKGLENANVRARSWGGWDESWLERYTSAEGGGTWGGSGGKAEITFVAFVARNGGKLWLAMGMSMHRGCAGMCENG